MSNSKDNEIKMTCPLCLSNDSFAELKGAKNSSFYRCKKCDLIFRTAQNFLSYGDEKERYLKHKNGLHDDGYVKFLHQAIDPTLDLLNETMIGLDFGCGPEPTLNKILAQKGISCDIYDPFFFPELANKKYDFIFATECFEHFFSPSKEMDLINKILKPGGILIIMTEFYADDKPFDNWYYANDPTHVCFYNNKTFEFIADKYGFEILKLTPPRLVQMKKQE